MNPAPIIQWAVTGLCNYRCRHCFVGNVNGELPLSGLEALCARMAEAGVREVCLTGGEPLLRADLSDLLRCLAEHKIGILQIATNGSLLTEDVLRRIAETGHRPEITVSYDGDGGCHDWLRNVPGAEEAAFRAMDLSREAGLTTGSLMTLHRGNLPFLRSSLRRLYAHGCSTVKVKPLLPLGRAGAEGTEVSPPAFPEMYDAFLDAIAGYYAGEYPLRLRLGGFFAADPDWHGWSVPVAQFPRNADCRDRSVCKHALSFPFLTAGGRLLPCAGLASFDELVAGAPSLLEMSLEEAMGVPSFRRFCNYTVGEQLERNAKCAACESAPECGGGCRMNAMASGDGFTGCDPSCCEFFGQGWREKIPGAIRRGKMEKILYQE